MKNKGKFWCILILGIVLSISYLSFMLCYAHLAITTINAFALVFAIVVLSRSWWINNS